MSISYNDVDVENIFMGYDGKKIKLQWYFSILNVCLAAPSSTEQNYVSGGF